MREVRACGLRPGDRFAFDDGCDGEELVTVGHVERTCYGPIAITEVWPAGADTTRSNGWQFAYAETVWTDQ